MNSPQLRKTVIGVVSLARRLIESGSRPRRRATFLCSAKEKYPKERRPGCRLNPALLRKPSLVFALRASRWLFKFAPGKFVTFTGGCRKGLLPLRQRAASLPPPNGLIPAKAPVLGAAYGIILTPPTNSLRYQPNMAFRCYCGLPDKVFATGSLERYLRLM
jgi:hypothetical protein